MPEQGRSGKGDSYKGINPQNCDKNNANDVLVTLSSVLLEIC